MNEERLPTGTSHWGFRLGCSRARRQAGEHTPTTTVASCNLSRQSGRHQCVLPSTASPGRIGHCTGRCDRQVSTAHGTRSWEIRIFVILWS